MRAIGVFGSTWRRPSGAPGRRSGGQGHEARGYGRGAAAPRRSGSRGEPVPARHSPLGGLVAAACALLVLLPSLARADDYDRWYAVEMGGQRAGWMHSQQATRGERIETRNEVRFELGRGDIRISVLITSAFLETAAGQPVSMDATIKLGQTPTRMHAVYAEDGIHVEVSKAGKTTRSTRPLPEGTWLTPAAATEFVRQRLAAGAAEMTVRTVDPGGSMDDPTAMLSPSVITRRDGRPATIEIMGKPAQVTRCVTTTSAQPGIESIEYLDASGVPVKTEVSLGAFPIVAVAVTRAEATAAHGGVEMMTSTFVKPDRKIEGARELKRGTYVLSVPEGKLPAVPTAGAQVFEALGEREGRLTVERGRSSAATEEEAASETLTKPSQTIDWEDEKVKELAKRATEGLGPGKPAKRAEAMRLFVHRYISKKSLGVGFASASEVARTREGDCTEHGVLLAALLRADGIPSRVVCGLVYADQFAGAENIFGYHLWTQALLEADGQKRWVDLDATLSADRPYDATHLGLATSALADGQSQEALLSIAMIIGRLGIRVEAVE